ncbi:hypothetical protein ACTWPT_30080 [Nonomuraea sp. 3N208]|uniref:hypothetical protein n=1 Tax=Nonomuraea sp. 3N208 TaxID=3457421 RepID=UPI003FD29E3C
MTPGPDGFSTAETLEHEPPRRRFPRSLLLVGTTALVVVTGAGVAAAAALSPSPSPTPTATGTATPSASSGTPTDQAPGQNRGWGRKMGFGGHSIHGEFVVPDGTGKYVTVATQYGDVTAIDQDSVTVKSEDGYTREYVVNGDTRINRGGDGIDAVKTGQKVMVRATVEGGTATAVAIHDTTLRDGQGRDGQGWRGKGGRWHGDHQPGQPPTSSPSPSSSPTTTS